MNERMLIVDHIDDIIENDEVIGKRCSDSTGESVNVKRGQGGVLKNKWATLQIGRAYSFTMGEFKGFPFVRDFTSVKDEFVKEAQRKVEAATPGFSPQEIGMWWKEVGENIRAGITKYDTAIGKAEIIAYKARMHAVLGIKDKEEP